MNHPIIILVETQLPENIGAVARAMKNFGLQQLRLINPLCDPLDPKAIAMSVGADNLLRNAPIYHHLTDAISDCHTVTGTTAAPRDMIKRYLTPHTWATQPSTTDLKQAIVFGCERTGLSNEDLVLCSNIITVPVDPNFSSLNLAQAVAVIAYEWFQTEQDSIAHTLRCGETQLATQEELSNFLNNLEQQLDETHYWRVDSKKPIMWRNLRNIFTRMDLTQQELRTLRGVFDALNKKSS